MFLPIFLENYGFNKLIIIVMGPLIPLEVITGQWDFVIALLIGGAFGFILEASGFSSSRNIAGVFYGYNFVVLRVFFTAMIVAMVGYLYFSYMGWIDMNLVLDANYSASNSQAGMSSIVGPRISSIQFGVSTVTSSIYFTFISNIAPR